MGDHELLQAYTQQGSQRAFADLVRRYLDLVYSAARRQVRASHLAEEITQNVFIDLARSAKKLKPSQPLAAWLFLVTRRKAIDALRSEARRHSRTEMLVEEAAQNPSGASGTIEPLLDEAVASLGEEDRRAVILRFFENRSLREVGDILGASEAAAQKRVRRALEQLRAYFGKRGVVLGAAAIATQLSVQAVVPAPAALAASVSSIAALTAVTTHVSQIILMTTVKKIAFSAALTLSVGAALFEARELSLMKEKMRALTREADELRAQHEAVLKTLSEREREFSALRATASGGDPEAEAALDGWLGRVQTLRTWLDKMPDKRIPQMAFLVDEDWLDVAKNAKVETELEARQALMNLRRLALERFGTSVNAALARHQRETLNWMPTSPAALVPYFDPPIDPSLLSNYEIAEDDWPGSANASGKPPAFVLRNKLVDDIYDWRIAHKGRGVTGNGGVSLSGKAISEAVREYRRLNKGRTPSEPAQLAPYLKRAIHPEYLK